MIQMPAGLLQREIVLALCIMYTLLAEWMVNKILWILCGWLR